MVIDLRKSLYPEQLDFVRAAIGDNGFKFITVAAGRQCGKSWALDRYSVALSCSKTKKEILWITPTHGQSGDAYDRVLELCEGLNLIISSTKSNSGRIITFFTGTIIKFMSAERYENLRGKHPDYLILDEFAFFKEGAWKKAISPYLIANKELVVVSASTFNGKDDFYDFYERGLSDDFPSYDTHILHYSMNPNVNMEFIEEQRLMLPKAVFDVEYEGIPMFGTSSVFGDYANVQTLSILAKATAINYYGIDVASGGDTGDSTVLTVLNSNREVVLIEEIREAGMVDQAKKIKYVLSKYNTVYGYIEKNGLGLGLFNILEKYPELKISPWTTTNESKQEIVSGMLLRINTNDIKLPTAKLCSKLDYEMSEYVVSRSSTGKLVYSHPKGSSTIKDDHVDSLNIANKALDDFGGSRSVTPKVNYSRYNRN